VLHQFNGGDGWKPLALLQGIDGNFYGVTEQGGGAGCTNGCGEVFEMDSFSPYTLHVLYQFTGGNQPYQPYNVLQGSDGTLYGLTYLGANGSPGEIFSLNTSGGAFGILHSFAFSDGYGTRSLLPPYGGVLYGASPQLGPHGGGSIFSINSNGSNFQLVYAFANGSDGGTPVALSRTTSGALYGVAQANGASTGELFRVNSDGSVTVLHVFAAAGSEGTLPNTLAPIQGLTGPLLLGTTIGGGTGNTGVIFEYDLTSNNFAAIYLFIYWWAARCAITTSPTAERRGYLRNDKCWRNLWQRCGVSVYSLTIELPGMFSTGDTALRAAACRSCGSAAAVGARPCGA
jgi:uncharacterized repeat protein (TIGR03803 family)